MSKKSAGKGLGYECNSYSLSENSQGIGSGSKVPHDNSFALAKSGKSIGSGKAAPELNEFSITKK